MHPELMVPAWSGLTAPPRLVRAALHLSLPHETVGTPHLVLADLAVIIGIHEREALFMLPFDLGDRHLAIAIDIQHAGHLPGTPLVFALLDMRHQFLLRKLAIAVGVGSLQHVDAPAAKFLKGNEAVLVRIEPGEAAAFPVLGSRLIRLGIGVLRHGGGSTNQRKGYSRQKDLAKHMVSPDINAGQIGVSHVPMALFVAA